MADERQPRIVEGVPVERAARRGAPEGVDVADLDAGPVVRRLDADRIVVALLAPADAAPLAITTRLVDGVVDAVFQPTIAKGPQSAAVAWHYALRLPAPAAALDAPTVRIVGLGEPRTVAVPPR